MSAAKSGLSKRNLLLGITLLLISTVGFLFSPIGPYSKESTAFCGGRDNLSFSYLKELEKSLTEVDGKARILKEYDWQSDGQALIQIMSILNDQLGEDLQPKIEDLFNETENAKKCKNNNQYTASIGSIQRKLDALNEKLLQADRWDIFNFPLWASNASDITYINSDLRQLIGSYKKQLSDS
jgi:hypothetical protein